MSAFSRRSTSVANGAQGQYARLRPEKSQMMDIEKPMRLLEPIENDGPFNFEPRQQMLILTGENETMIFHPKSTKTQQSASKFGSKHPRRKSMATTLKSNAFNVKNMPTIPGSKVTTPSPYISDETAALLKGRTTRTNGHTNSSSLFSIKNVHVQHNGHGVAHKNMHLRKKSKIKKGSRNDGGKASETVLSQQASPSNVLQAAGKFMLKKHQHSLPPIDTDLGINIKMATNESADAGNDYDYENQLELA